MAKVQIKSERITPFGGIFHVREQLSHYVGPVIDKVLGLRCTSFGYQYGEIAAFDKGNTAERVKFSRFVASETKRRGMVIVWWMGLIDRKSCRWSEPEIVDALFEGIGMKKQ